MSTVQKKNIKKRLKSAIKKIRNNSYDPVNKTLYHFTNYKVLKSILNTQQLWLSKYQDLDDPSEIKFLKDNVFRIICEELTNDIGKRNFNTFVSTFDRYKQLDIFSLSICENLDNKYLWEKYADNYRGVAIGFSSSYFEYISPDELAEGDWPKIFLKVKYGNNNINNDFGNVSKLFAQLLDMEHEKNHLKFLILFSVMLLSEMPRYKDNKWQDQVEHRIYMMDKASDNKIPDRLRLNDKCIVDDLVKNFLNEIVIGKKSSIKREEIENLLEKSTIQRNIKIVDRRDSVQ